MSQIDKLELSTEEVHDLMAAADTDGDGTLSEDEYADAVIRRNVSKFASLWFFFGTLAFIACTLFLQGMGYGRSYLVLLILLWIASLSPGYLSASGPTAVVRARVLPCEGESCRFRVERVRYGTWPDLKSDLTCLLDLPSDSITAIFRLECLHDLRGHQSSCTRKKCQSSSAVPMAVPLSSPSQLFHSNSVMASRWDAHLEVQYKPMEMTSSNQSCQPQLILHRISLWLFHFRVEALMSIFIIAATMYKFGVVRTQGRSIGLNHETFMSHYHRLILPVFFIVLVAWHVLNGSGEHTPSVLDDYIGEIAIVFAFCLMMYMKVITSDTL